MERKNKMKKLLSTISIILSLSFMAGSVVGTVQKPNLASPLEQKISTDKTELYKVFKFSHAFKEYRIVTNLDYQEYIKKSQIKRQWHGYEYVTFTDDIIEIAIQLGEIAIADKQPVDAVVMSFVQYLPYESDNIKYGGDYPKYPIETLVDGGGDCEDTSYLAVSLLRALGVNSVLLNPYGHMAVGTQKEIWNGGMYVTYNGIEYSYYEPTMIGWHKGMIPDDYKGKKIKIIN